MNKGLNYCFKSKVRGALKQHCDRKSVGKCWQTFGFVWRARVKSSAVLTLAARSGAAWGDCERRIDVL